MWHFVENEVPVGPVTEQEMIDRIRGGRLKPTTLVWSEGLTSWESAESIETFKRLFRATPPPLPTAPKTPPLPAFSSKRPIFADDVKTYDPTDLPLQRAIVAKGSPWSRYAARLLDQVIWAVPAVFVLLVIAAITQNPWFINLLSNQVAAILMIMPLFGLFNALTMTFFGNTIGKTIMGVNVRPENGRKAGLSFYLLRELKVLVFGMGIGFPIVAFFTQLYQHKKVKIEGQATYDRDLAEVNVYFTSKIRMGVVLTCAFLAAAYLNSPAGEALGYPLGQAAYTLVSSFR
ncbi:DUF4339 domain-containing protein [Phyllobacterium sp. SYP-B3895]|uniref:RDD family protein n=1 Tax=Phyllobacterium sp. SYP-B3895 TaxID=2663240 RepID=UPI0012999306|nr:RDD family protein [Phyllobacterium sp. SYP-B3895]MRG54200.1 DUF4339 domain-containing protein [Phyllobacterium sp. SYP-B3895]